MNIELNKIDNYLNANCLKLNVDKTNAMIITNKYKYNNINLNNINLRIQNSILEIVNEIKYLGVFLDSTLNFKRHLLISDNLSLTANITVYKSIIQPHFDYCSSIVYLMDKNCKDQLQKLQNRAMRIILKCNRHTPIHLMLDALQWMPISLPLKYLTMIFIFKILNNLLPSYFNTKIRNQYT
ncbi:hypothetical protein NQ318_002758 [Aromia moschata]|uniref:Reverse transcriptase domain-containing protein n=1 Tax=Aromia moschata TaxID=1265417 RepID=A0AAV8Y3W1_9CUCU|nr:hypothetical protein NQ318_002758 [Aromia moschata]